MLSANRILAIAAKECLHMVRDRMTFGMIIMIPLVQLLLFGFAINSVVRNIPIAVVDLSGDAAARIITEQIRVTQVVNITDFFDTPSEAEAAIVAGRVRAALIFPKDLSQRIARKETVAQWMIDGSDTMVSAALLPLRSMPLALESGALSEISPPRTPRFEMALFFNPERRSAVNIVPGLTAIVLTMTMILFTSLSLVREQERGNMELLITTPVLPVEVMLGKLAPYVFVGILQLAIILGLGRVVFSVPFNGDLLSLTIITIAFIGASLTLGLLISTLAKTQLQAMQMTIFILLPSILLSGFMFPYEAMPVVAQYIAEAFPATHFTRLIRGVVLRGAHAGQLLEDILWLVGFTAAMLVLATRLFRKTLD